MNDKITMTRLAAMLAISTGKQKKLCEDFLRELFSIVEEELLKGENVRIKGFGTFKLIDVEPRKSVNVANGEETIIPGHSKVLFVAAKELASRVNLPFEAFEAVEIADELPTDSLEGDEEPEGELNSISNINSGADEEPSREEADEEPSQEELDEELKEGSEEELMEDEESIEAYTKDQNQTVSNDSYEIEDSLEIINSENEDNCNKLPQDNRDSMQEEYESSELDEKSHKFTKGFIAGFVTALVGGGIVFAVGYLLGFSFGISKGESIVDAISTESAEMIPNVSDSVATTKSLVVDSISKDNLSKNSDAGSNDVPTKASDEPVYDTVSTTRYLTTIAKEHYGNFNLWPIIYEENKDILGHPDRIRPGTKVVVPPLSKYGIDPQNAEQIKLIKQKGIEIYARYR